MKKAQPSKKPFHFICPHCKTEHRRALWSIAHMESPQVFTCTCGKKIELNRNCR